MTRVFPLGGKPSVSSPSCAASLPNPWTDRSRSVRHRALKIIPGSYRDRNDH